MGQDSEHQLLVHDQNSQYNQNLQYDKDLQGTNVKRQNNEYQSQDTKRYHQRMLQLNKGAQRHSLHNLLLVSRHGRNTSGRTRHHSSRRMYAGARDRHVLHMTKHRASRATVITTRLIRSAISLTLKVRRLGSTRCRRRNKGSRYKRILLRRHRHHSSGGHGRSGPSIPTLRRTNTITMSGHQSKRRQRSTNSSHRRTKRVNSSKGRIR